ncbi:hypothetical protein K2P47_04090 [Patescibacteria group bacterium]|nr:hypothetical protein [Patescibacteria group bacterium]
MTVLSKVRLYISNKKDKDEMAIEVIVLNLPVFPREYNVKYHLKSQDGLFVLDELEIDTDMGIHVESRNHHHDSYAVNISMAATNMSTHRWQDLLAQCNESSGDAKRYPYQIIFDL